MRYMSVLTFRHRRIALALVAAAAIVAVPLALSPPLAQGSPESPATREECREEMERRTRSYLRGQPLRDHHRPPQRGIPDQLERMGRSAP